MTAMPESADETVSGLTNWLNSQASSQDDTCQYWY